MRSTTRLTLFLAALFVMSVVMAPSAEAQRRRPGGPPGDPATPPPAAPTTVEVKPAPIPEKEEYLAIRAGRVHTVSGPVLHDVTILCKNGRIIEIGPRVVIPDKAEVIDASTMEVYPGLVAVSTTNVLGGGAPEDSTDVFALNMATALAAGITTGVTGSTAAKLTFGTVEDMIVSRQVFENFSYSTRNPNGRRQVREGLNRVRAYLRDLAAYEEARRTDPSATAPDNRWIQGQFATYLRLLKGETTAVVDANSMHELLQICELAEAYGIRFVVRGAVEGWTVPDRLGRAGVSAIITPRTRSDPNEDSMRPNGSSIENAAILARHGVAMAFLPTGSLFGPGTSISFGGLAGRDLLHLNMEAAFAVRGGLSNQDAIKAITLDAARILGVDRRVGSIEVGKDADFAIADGDLLHYMTHIRWTIVNGRVAYDKMKDTLLDHIRPDGDRNAPAPHDYWPRRLGADF